jgi:hypothetical protein
MRFGGAIAVHLRGVEVGDARFDSPLDGAQPRRLVAAHHQAADGTAAKAQRRDAQIGVA